MAALLSSSPTKRRATSRPAPLRLYAPDLSTAPRWPEASDMGGRRAAGANAGANLAVLERDDLAQLRTRPLSSTVAGASPWSTRPALFVEPALRRERPLVTSRPATPPHRARRGGARLRRALSALATTVLFVGLWFGAGALRGAMPSPAVLSGSRPVAGGYLYRVRPGDTLWSIAARLEPSADPRPLVDELAAQVRSGTLVVGETLRLP